MRKNLVLMGLFAALVVGLFTAFGTADAVAQEKQKPIKVLLVTGEDVSAHDWRLMSESTRTALVDSGKFDVRVCEDPAILESKKALDDYDVIVFTVVTMKRFANLSDDAKQNLMDFVKGGKGFYVQHLASGSFKDWDDFEELAGRRWKFGTSGHGPRAPFTANIVKEHPITKGMEDFEIDDELYAKLQGDKEIEVLVSADSDWSGKTEPLLFVFPCGEGRCVHNAFGHDDKVILDPNMRKLISRSVEWAATGKVSD